MQIEDVQKRADGVLIELNDGMKPEQEINDHEFGLHQEQQAAGSG
jgi:hypothetical protein